MFIYLINYSSTTLVLDTPAPVASIAVLHPLFRRNYCETLSPFSNFFKFQPLIKRPAASIVYSRQLLLRATSTLILLLRPQIDTPFSLLPTCSVTALISTVLVHKRRHISTHSALCTGLRNSPHSRRSHERRQTAISCRCMRSLGNNLTTPQ